MVVSAGHPDEFSGGVALSPGGDLYRFLIEPKFRNAPPQGRLMLVWGEQEMHGRFAQGLATACGKAGGRWQSRTHPGGHHFPENRDAMRPEAAKFLTARDLTQPA